VSKHIAITLCCSNWGQCVDSATEFC
jgi:hypothetical protein